MEERIPTALWVAGHLRSCHVLGIPVYVLKSGATESGTVMLKVFFHRERVLLFSQVRDIEGGLSWIEVATLTEQEVNISVDRYLKADPDLWVIEIEAGAKQALNCFDLQINTIS